MTLGYFMANKEIVKSIPFRYLLLSLIPLFVIAALEGRYIMPRATISILPITFIIVLLLLNRNIVDYSPFVAFCRKSSILIYLLHGVIKQIIILFTGIGFGIPLFLGAWLVSIAGAYLIIWGSKYFKILTKLY